MNRKEGKQTEIKLNKWSVAAGALSVAAWFVAAEWGQRPFELAEYIWQTLIAAFFAFICFALGFVPAGLASDKKDWFEKLRYAIGGLGLNAALIWYIFFK